MCLLTLKGKLARVISEQTNTQSQLTANYMQFRISVKPENQEITTLPLLGGSVGWSGASHTKSCGLHPDQDT